MLTSPYSSHNLTIEATGRFEESLIGSANLTTYVFIDAASASFVVSGTENFCNNRVLQTIDSITDNVCPPAEGSAVLIRHLSIPSYMPSVSQGISHPSRCRLRLILISRESGMSTSMCVMELLAHEMIHDSSA